MENEGKKIRKFFKLRKGRKNALYYVLTYLDMYIVPNKSFRLVNTYIISLVLHVYNGETQYYLKIPT